MVADFAAHIRAGDLWVAEVEMAVVGYIHFFPDEGVMRLENVAVHPGASAKGIGRRLITHCETLAQSHGLRAVCLYTNVKMAGNLRLYPSLGYAEVDRRHEDGFDRVFFEKRL